jgi:hypothetical protein
MMMPVAANLKKTNDNLTARNADFFAAALV